MLETVLLSLGSVSFDELAKESDFLAVCCALTPETKEICNKNLFSKMKNTSIFINTSRYYKQFESTHMIYILLLLLDLVLFLQTLVQVVVC